MLGQIKRFLVTLIVLQTHQQLFLFYIYTIVPQNNYYSLLSFKEEMNQLDINVSSELNNFFLLSETASDSILL